MQNLELKHLDQASISSTTLTIDALARIVPSCITEVKDSKTGSIKHAVDFHVLRQLLGDQAVEDAPEAYEFTWVGKQEARREAAKSISKTLRPVPEDSVDWDNTQNIYIEGDNLEALKLLQKSYLGKVKMIYIDPPYNTGNDFVYHDDFKQSQSEYDEVAGNVDEKGNRLVSRSNSSSLDDAFKKNTDSNGRFHSDWCSMIYSRLMIARSLLTEDGVIFISIDDNEVENLRKICDEVFGEGNYESTISWRRRTNQPNDKSKMIAKVAENIVVFARNGEHLANTKAFHGVPLSEERKKGYSNPDQDPKGPWSTNPWKAATGRGGTTYTIKTPTGKIYNETWYGSEKTFNDLLKQRRVHWTDNGEGVPRIKIYLKDVEQEGQAAINFFTCDKFGSNQEGSAEIDSLFKRKGMFDNPKPTRLLKSIQLLATDKDSIILDFFSGSATTAHAVMQLNAEDGGKRRFIMVQLPEESPKDSEAYKAGYKNICEIGKERIRRAGAKIKEESKASSLDTGFRVFRIDSGNMKDVELSPSDVDQTKLDFFLDNVKDDRTELDLLFGSMLNWGVQLSLPMSMETVDGCNIYTVNEGDLVACLTKDQPVTENIVRAIAEKSPLRVLFRDGSFASDADKINIFELFKQLMDWSDDEIIKNVRVL